MGFLNYLIIVYFIIVLLHEHWCRPPLIVYLKLLKIVLGLCLFGALECDLAQILAIKRDKGVWRFTGHWHSLIKIFDVLWILQLIHVILRRLSVAIYWRVVNWLYRNVYVLIIKLILLYQRFSKAFAFVELATHCTFSLLLLLKLVLDLLVLFGWVRCETREKAPFGFLVLFFDHAYWLVALDWEWLRLTGIRNISHWIIVCLELQRGAAACIWHHALNGSALNVEVIFIKCREVLALVMDLAKSLRLHSMQVC